MDSITQKADQAYLLAWESGPSTELEKIISQDARRSYGYARDIIKGRFQLGENAISQDIARSYYYARNVLGDRFQLAENTISQSAEYSYFYARDIIKGKLPEPMHNKMIAYAIANDEWAEDYFELIKLPLGSYTSRAENE